MQVAKIKRDENKTKGEIEAEKALTGKKVISACISMTQYEFLRDKAHNERKSMSEIYRDLIEEAHGIK